MLYVAGLESIASSGILVVGMGLVLWGCWLWTKLKGRHWAYMFWGLLTPLGLLGILFLKNKNQQELIEKADKEDTYL
jgi:hypothetical protein